MPNERLIDLDDTTVIDDALHIKTSNGESLGSMLRRQKLERQQLIVDKERGKEDKRRKKIIDFFDRIKNNLQKAVEENKEIRPAVVPEYVIGLGLGNNLRCFDVGHKDYHLWVHFSIWCQENDLTASIKYDTNYGTYGAWTLTIEPKND